MRNPGILPKNDVVVCGSHPPRNAFAMNEIGRLLGSGKEAEVYEHGEFVLKLYRSTASKHDAFTEAAKLAIVESLGLPAPKVHAVGKYDGRWGLIMDRAPGQCFAEGMTSAVQTSIYLDEMVRLHRRLHERSGTGLPSLTARLAANIRQTERLGSRCRDRLLAQLEAMPDGDRLCHGDFHPRNILGSPGQAVIVDWLDACRGNPAADVCRSYLLMRRADPATAGAYAEAYAGASGLDPTEILAWLPLLAAARLAENVPNEESELMRLAGAT
jgi:aminoglycoside phosphotransferase (APT) family kinase protein